MRDKVVAVDIEISKIVTVHSNDGGYLGMTCNICKENGWSGDSQFGYHYGTKGLLRNVLVHAEACPMNEHITLQSGKLK